VRVIDLQKKLEDLRKKETIAQTREQLLDEEKVKLLSDIQELLTEVEVLDLLSKEDLTPQNLTAVVDALNKHIEAEVEKSSIPKELLQ